MYLVLTAPSSELLSAWTNPASSSRMLPPPNCLGMGNNPRTVHMNQWSRLSITMMAPSLYLHWRQPTPHRVGVTPGNQASTLFFVLKNTELESNPARSRCIGPDDSKQHHATYLRRSTTRSHGYQPEWLQRTQSHRATGHKKKDCDSKPCPRNGDRRGRC